MEKKKDQEPETNELSTNEDQSQPNVALATNANRTSSPLHDNAPPFNQQHPPVLQRPCAAQHAGEPSPFISRPSIPSLSPSPIVLSQWQQFPHLHQNPTSHQAQHGQPSHFAQSTVPFWMPQHPVYLLPGVNAPTNFQPFTPLGTTNADWQAPGALGGGTLSENQSPIPCHQVGYTYSGFPGHWDHSSGFGHTQPSQSSCTYTFPGPYGLLSLPPSPFPSCAASLGQPFQRGTIRPPAKLSQKHQQLWAAQSAENVQLWNVINVLQSEISDYKNRLMKLEAEVSSLKPTVEEPTAQGIGIGSAGQPSKRGRPKRPSVNVLTSPRESQPRARGRRPTPYRAQKESRSLIFEKVTFDKVEDKEKKSSTATSKQENIVKTSNIAKPQISGNMELNGNGLMMPVFHNQGHQEFNGIQIGEFGLTSSSQLKNIDENSKDLKSGYSILSQQSKRMNNKGASAIYMGAAGNGSLRWHSNITSDDLGGNLLNMGSQGFYDSGRVIRQEAKIVPGWGLPNEEDASEELGDAVAGSTKDANDEEMGDDASSGAEGTDLKQDDSAYQMDGAVGISPKALHPHDNW